MKNLLKKFLPKSIKKDLMEHYTQKVYNMHATRTENFKKKVPGYELDTKHIANLKPLLNRKQLLQQLPKNAIVAEIGVDTGDFSEEIIACTTPQKLHLIDLWGTKRYHEGKREWVEKKFVTAIENDQIIINRGLSTEVAKQFQDGYFDWVYIDTDHSYKNTLKELQLYSKKVKPDGIIAGHDFVIGNWKGLVKYGVIDAVYEFCQTQNWQLVYLTLENRAHTSFAIKRI
ncbi:class I SAM-dependent methyltransferase [Marixanthomonas sp. SCSIO 43207]|uniref:class I SAM-dependent methyltransferase n=1 Tax=Marixanthomonas sp. SCSIO 43207 TaxID=2779360 RepID=UPI001CA88A36|nr:class I SAM-dependent methyltransferase [Marixanthomonas sp. SCSIO 43207]UAB81237.1 class I SAM-dependent methyltransferase [Marixanthomonas sp. SCSIO 43207]